MSDKTFFCVHKKEEQHTQKIPMQTYEADCFCLFFIYVCVCVYMCIYTYQQHPKREKVSQHIHLGHMFTLSK